MENEGLHVHSSQQTEEAGIYHVFIKIPAKDVGMGTTQGLHQCPISMSLFIPGPVRTRPPAVLALKMNLLQSGAKVCFTPMLCSSWSRLVSGNTSPKGTGLRCPAGLARTKVQTLE